MSKRFEWHSYYTTRVIDTKTNKIIKVIDTLNQQQERIEELEKELTELKEKAIVPRFKIGQEIWYVGFFNNIESRIVNRIELVIENNKLCEIYRLEHYGTDDYSCCVMPFDSDRCFATEQEAIEKLKEIQGNE